MTAADLREHIKRTWGVGITVGVNPPGLLRTAVSMADERTPEAWLTGAVFAAEAVRHLIQDGGIREHRIAELGARAANLSEELQQFAAERKE